MNEAIAPRHKGGPAGLLRHALTIRIVMAAIFMACFGLLLARTAPEGRGGSLRIELPPPTVDPFLLMPIPPEQALASNAEIPIIASEFQPATPFRFAASAASRDRAIDCLAAAVWYEAGDNAQGERAVAQTVLNRVRHPAFPATVCGVVFQGSERRTGCQFTFTCDGALARTPSVGAWVRARAIADAAIGGQVDSHVGFATHYHADYVVPYWRSSLEKIAQVGPHIFYRWPGYWGTAPSFRRKTSNEEPRVVALARLSPVHAQASPDDRAEEILAGSPESPLSDTVAAGTMTELSANVVQPEQGEPEHDPAAAKSEPRSQFVKLDPDAFPGSYATAALTTCHGKANCSVLGWRDAGRVAARLPLDAAAKAALSFVYVRDTRSGAEGVYWNCAQIARSNKAQCLPQGAALDRLLAGF